MHRQTSDRILWKLAEASTASSTTDDRLNSILAAYYDDILSDPVSARLFAVDAGFISPVAREVCAAWRERFGELLCKAIDEPASEGLLRSAVVKGLLGLGVDWMESGFAAPKDEIVTAGRRMRWRSKLDDRGRRLILDRDLAPYTRSRDRESEHSCAKIRLSCSKARSDWSTLKSVSVDRSSIAASIRIFQPGRSRRMTQANEVVADSGSQVLIT